MNTKPVNSSNTENHEIHNAPVSLKNYYNLHPYIKNQEHKLSQSVPLADQQMQEQKYPSQQMQEQRIPWQQMQEQKYPSQMEEQRIPWQQRREQKYPVQMQEYKLSSQQYDKIISALKVNPYETLNSLDERELSSFIDNVLDLYHNKRIRVLSDPLYDYVSEYYQKKYNPNEKQIFLSQQRREQRIISRQMQEYKLSPQYYDKIILLLKENPYETLNSLDKRELSSVLDYLLDSYYNKGTPLISDQLYDYVIEYYLKKYNPNEKSVGMIIKEKVKPSQQMQEYKLLAPNDTMHKRESLCIDNVCFNSFNHGDTLLDPTDKGQSYSGFNFGSSTKLQYDRDFLKDDIEQSTAPLLSVLDPNRVKSNSQCLSTFGPRAGHNGYGDNIPIEKSGLTPAQDLVDIDSIMSNRNVKQSRAKKGNVNPINVFDLKTYDCKECDKYLDPLDTIQTYPKQLYKEISINRFYDLNIEPQANIYYDGAVNTQLEAKDNYENPYPYSLSNTSSNTVHGSPITRQTAVYNDKTNSFLTNANGGSVPYVRTT